MKHISLIQLLIVGTLIVVINFSVCAQSGTTSTGAESAGNKLVYADFQHPVNGRPVSVNGGRTALNKWAQNMGSAPKMRGLENSGPPSPALARVTDTDTAAAFQYDLMPNEWAGVAMEVFGRPEKDGKLVPDDISAYKFMSVRIFAKGAQSIRIELIARGQGYNLESGYPFATIRVTPGFNTYKFKLDSFTQPEWATKLDFKRDVLKKLTSVTIGVNCDKCTFESGTVVVDNIVFEK